MDEARAAKILGHEDDLEILSRLRNVVDPTTTTINNYKE